MGRGRTTIDERRSSAAAAVRVLTCAALLLVASFTASGCGSSADPAGAAPADAPKQRGGSMTVGMDQEPVCLNTWLVCGGMAVATMITSAIFDSPIMIDGDGQYAPQLAVEVPTTDNGGVVTKPDGTMQVTLHLKPEARWSDGRPITCDDAKFTLTTIMDDRWLIGSRLGYDLITDLECPDQQTVVYTFKEPYAPFMRIVGTAPLLPKHALEGKDFNTFMNDRIPVSSGPFVFDHWDRSVELALTRNRHYWDAGADDLPWLDTMRFVFVPDTNTLKIQLRTGEVDLVNPPPDTSLRQELEEMPRASFQSEPGVFWEQLAFNNAKAPTNDVNVRTAIAYSIDRTQITDVVLKKQVGVLQSTLLSSQKAYFVPAWEDVKPDKQRAEALLKKSGYTRSGQYFTKAGKPLTVLFKSTAGNVLRLKVAQLLQQELKANGIKMDIALELPAVFFGQSTIQGQFNIALWAWSSGVDPSQRTLFSCDQIPSEANDYSGNNNYRYCNEHVTELLKQADVTPDVDARAKLLAQVQHQMREDMPILPLFQRPETIAFNTRMQGMDVNSLGSLAWNARDWAVRK